MSDLANPFKFLDAYEKEEVDIFFGREDETEELYHITFDSRILLIYGASGTGKTSLIQAGLANKFNPTKWKSIFIRRQENLNETLVENLKKEFVENHISLEDFPSDPVEALMRFYRRIRKPLYLIFDQFEEIFVWNQNPKEQDDFLQFLKNLLDTDFPCSILIIIREEFLANLSVFEKSIPNLFKYRFRVEQMRKVQILEVIIRTLRRFNEKELIQLEVDQLYTLSESIYSKLESDKLSTTVELTYLQVLLHRMYQKSQKLIDDGIPVFDLALLDRLGEFDDVIRDFLNSQLELVEQLHLQEDDSLFRPLNDPSVALAFLRVLVSAQGTKIPLSRQKIIEALRSPIFDDSMIEACIRYFSSNRILRELGRDSYELAHDTLAKSISEKEMVLLPIPDLPQIPIPGDFYKMSNYPFGEDLAALFFGRQLELRRLYNLIAFQRQQFVVLYGDSGVGKTTLIRAGLTLRLIKADYKVHYFDLENDSDWDILKNDHSITREITSDSGSQVLVIDHFIDRIRLEKEAREVFDRLGTILVQDPRVRLLFVLPKDSIADLLEYEEFFPGILDNRMELLPLKEEELQLVVKKIISTLGGNIDEPDQITNQLPEYDRKRSLGNLLDLCKKYITSRENDVIDLPPKTTIDSVQPDFPGGSETLIEALYQDLIRNGFLIDDTNESQDFLFQQRGILEAFPTPISEPLRRYLVSKKLFGSFSMQPLIQLSELYSSCLRFLGSILLAQIADKMEYLQRDLIRINQYLDSKQEEELNQFFWLGKIDHKLIRLLIELINRWGDDPFVAELKYWSQEISSHEQLNSSISFLENLSKRIHDGQIEASEISRWQGQGNEALFPFLSSISFLTRYSLVVVKGVDVIRQGGSRDPRYSFSYSISVLEEGFFSPDNEQLVLVEDSLVPRQILLFNNVGDDPIGRSYLNLSPFIYDEAIDDINSRAVPMFFGRWKLNKEGNVDSLFFTPIDDPSRPVIYQKGFLAGKEKDQIETLFKDWELCKSLFTNETSGSLGVENSDIL